MPLRLLLYVATLIRRVVPQSALRRLLPTVIPPRSPSEEEYPEPDVEEEPEVEYEPAARP